VDHRDRSSVCSPAAEQAGDLVGRQPAPAERVRRGGTPSRTARSDESGGVGGPPSQTTTMAGARRLRTGRADQRDGGGAHAGRGRPPRERGLPRQHLGPARSWPFDADRRPPGSSRARRRRPAERRACLVAVAKTAGPPLAEATRRRPRSPTTSPRGWAARRGDRRPRRAVVLPLAGAAAEPLGAAVLGLNERRPADEDTSVHEAAAPGLVRARRRRRTRRSAASRRAGRARPGEDRLRTNVSRSCARR
jgi:hypothetical protein